MRPVGFEPAIPENERLQTYILDTAAIGIGLNTIKLNFHLTASSPWAVHENCLGISISPITSILHQFVSILNPQWRKSRKIL
jgi:hypothetical protein